MDIVKIVGGIRMEYALCNQLKRKMNHIVPISHILNLNIGYKSFCCCCNHFTPFLNPSINASEQTRCTSGIHTPLFRLIGHVAQARLFPLACFAAVVIPFILLLIIVLIAIVRKPV